MRDIWNIRPEGLVEISTSALPLLWLRAAHGKIQTPQPVARNARIYWRKDQERFPSMLSGDVRARAAALRFQGRSKCRYLKPNRGPLPARSVETHPIVVSKEMYSFEESGRATAWTLRPELPPGFARAFLSNGWQQHVPLKLFRRMTAGFPLRAVPQKGAYRQVFIRPARCGVIGAGRSGGRMSNCPLLLRSAAEGAGHR